MRAFGSCDEDRLPDRCVGLRLGERGQFWSKRGGERTVFRQKLRQPLMTALSNDCYDFGV